MWNQTKRNLPPAKSFSVGPNVIQLELAFLIWCNFFFYKICVIAGSAGIVEKQMEREKKNKKSVCKSSTLLLCYQQFIEIRCHACTCIIAFRCMVKLPKIYSAEMTVFFSWSKTHSMLLGTCCCFCLPVWGEQAGCSPDICHELDLLILHLGFFFNP